MKTYEQMFALNPSLDEEQEKKLVEKLTAVIENDGGQVLDSKRWGKRRLAYNIKGQMEGTYWVLIFKGENKIPAELRRVVKITEGFLRDIIIDLTDYYKAQKKREEYAKLAEVRRASRVPKEKKEPIAQEETPTATPIIPEDLVIEESKVD